MGSLAASQASRERRSGSPTILLSVDRTLWHRAGVSRLTYERALRRAGARVIRLDYTAMAAGDPPEEAASRLLDRVDGLVLSGGGDVDPGLFGGPAEIGRGVKPARDRFELALVEAARRREIPLLAICRGAQLLNVAAGGTLRSLRTDPVLRSRHRNWRGHAVEVEPESLLARVIGSDRLGRVVSWHGQAIDRPGAGLRVTGRAADGVVEAVEPVRGEGQWLLAVQWHPELSPRSQVQRRLFAALVEAAGAARTGDPKLAPRP